jgi:hypothetical protein
MDIYTRLLDGFKGKHCRLKSIQVLIQSFSTQPHLHLTLLRTVGSGAFFRQALAEQLAIPPSPVSLAPDPCTKRGRHERKKYRLA